jgi:hypothetical protein
MKKMAAKGARGLLLVLGMVGFILSGCAGMSSQKPGGVVVEEMTSTATVTAVDTATRAVTLKFEDNTLHTYKLTDAVKNFDQIKVGDTVKTTYVEAVAIFVAKTDEQPGLSQTQNVQVAAKGEKPGIVMSNTTQITAKVTAIDYAKRTVTLQGPGGEVNTYPVDQSVEKFNSVKVGDDLVVQVTDALMIAVEKP